MRRFVLTLASLALLGAFGASLFAEGWSGRTSLETQADYGFPNHEAVDASGLVPIAYGVGEDPAGTRKVGSALGNPELKVILSRVQVLPFLAGGGALTRDNNLALEYSGELSPVSLNANIQATLTPVAFLKLRAGAGLGTGWDIGFVGLALNEAGIMAPQSFGGLVYRGWVGGTFQFDLAAVLPGEWNHLVVLASPKIQYQAYTGARADQAWLWEADKGMNFNGVKLTGDYLVGYQMPLALDLVGLLLQTEGWLGSVRDRSPGIAGVSGWGSDFTYLRFGPLFDIRINESSSIAILPQFRTGIQWTAGTEWNLDFQARVYKAPYTYFDRLVFDYTLEL